MDIVEFINSEVANFFRGDEDPDVNFNLVKKHSESLEKAGEFSFPTNLSIWKKHLNLTTDAEIPELQSRLLAVNNVDDSRLIEKLVDTSARWPTPLQNVRVESDRCILYLERIKSIQYALRSVHNSSLFLAVKIDGIPKDVHFKTMHEQEGSDLNEYRALLVKSVLENLTKYSSGVDSAKESSIEVEVKPIKRKICKAGERNVAGHITIFSGNVTDEQHKVATITTSEYMNMRAKDMQLMAMHKYGVRVKNESCFRNLINQLGEAAVKVDLLEIKHTSPVSVKKNGQGCTKGASFILYNSARIETLLRTFEDRVSSGVYPKLPDVENIDISLLNDGEEWKLVFNYILPFPNLIKRCLEGLEEGKCAPHFLLQFLCGLVGVFSVYYRRVRVLLDGRDHLIPVIHARIYLVKCIREVLNRILAILNIEPIQCM